MQPPSEEMLLFIGSSQFSEVGCAIIVSLHLSGKLRLREVKLLALKVTQLP